MGDAVDTYVRTIYDAFNAREMDRLMGYLAEDVCWEEQVAPPDGGIFEGRAAVRAHVFDRLLTEWKDFHIEPEEIDVMGSVAIVTGRWRGEHLETGTVMEEPFCHVWTVEEGRVTRLKHITDPEVMQRVWKQARQAETL